MAQEEQVLMNLYRTRKAYWAEYLCSGLLLLGMGSLRVKGITFNPLWNRILLAFILLVLFCVEISRLSHRLEVTESKVLIVNGLIKRSKKHLFISSITDIDVNQKIFQRILDYGDVHIKSSSGQILESKDISCPAEVMERLEKLVNRSITSSGRY